MKLKSFFLSNQSLFNLIKYIGVSILLIIFVLLCDYNIIPLKEILPVIMITDVNKAHFILAALAGSLLTISTFTFSVILTVLHLYLSNFTPRMVENFLNRKDTMKILGIYIGGFVYCILALILIKGNDETEVIAGSIGGLYSFLCMGYFVRFVQNVIFSLKTGNIINGLYKEAEKSVQKSIQKRAGQKKKKAEETQDFFAEEILAAHSGFIEEVDFKGILSQLKDVRGQFMIGTYIGQHIAKEEKLGEISASEKLSEEVKQKIEACFMIQPQKIVSMDYNFGITKLVEVGVRALSPGINDPNTAIHCLYKIGELIGIVASVDDDKIIVHENGAFQILMKDFDLKREIHLAYEQLLHYGKEDLSVVRAMFQSLQVAMDKALSNNRKEILAFEQYVFEKTAPFYPLPIEAAQIEAVRIK